MERSADQGKMILKCTNGHDRCYEGADEDCPYCEKIMQAKILIGIPGTGKSTYADKQKDFTIISRDAIIEKFAKENNLTYTEAFGKINQAHVDEWFWADLINACQNRKDIIIDRTNTSKKVRRGLISGLVEYRYTIEAVVFVVPEPELKKRLQDRAQKTGKFIPDHVLKNMAAKYETPSKEEGFDKITYVRA
jgi:predicted kinase